MINLIKKDTVKLKHEEKFVLKFSHQVIGQNKKRIEFYFSFPRESKVKSSIFSNQEFLYRNIKSESLYTLQDVDLSFAQSKFIRETDVDSDSYRIDLNVFTYHCLELINQKAKLFKKNKENFDPADLLELLQITSNVLKNFRNDRPSSKKLIIYFEQADNYLSWSIEQIVLNALIDLSKKIPQDKKNLALSFCRDESEYRAKMNYNSKNILVDPNKISNKISLLKKIIEQGVIFKEKSKELGWLLRKFVNGFVASFIMLFIYLFLIEASNIFKELTTVLALIIALTYGFRDIFKEDARNIIFQFLRKGRPLIHRNLFDSASGQNIGSQREWLFLVNENQINQDVKNSINFSYRKNKRCNYYLYYRTDSNFFLKNFRTGYRGVQEKIFFDLSYFVRGLASGKNFILKEDSGKIVKEHTEKRYEINILIIANYFQQESNLFLYKAIINSSRILHLEVIE